MRNRRTRLALVTDGLSSVPSMASDDPPDTVQLTYAELGQRRGISRQSAERLARRRRWHKTIGNDGQTRVAVPQDWASLAPTDNPEDVRGRRVDPVPSLRAAVEELRAQGAALREQLQREVVRADKAEAEVSALRAEIEQGRGDSRRAWLRRLLRLLPVVLLLPIAAKAELSCQDPKLLDAVRRDIAERNLNEGYLRMQWRGISPSYRTGHPQCMGALMGTRPSSADSYYWYGWRTFEGRTYIVWEPYHW